MKREIRRCRQGHPRPSKLGRERVERHEKQFQAHPGPLVRSENQHLELWQDEFGKSIEHRNMPYRKASRSSQDDKDNIMLCDEGFMEAESREWGTRPRHA